MFKKFPFPKLLQHELDNLDNVVWMSSPDFDAEEAKAENKALLTKLLNDKELHESIAALLDTTVNIDQRNIQEHVESQLLGGFSDIASSIRQRQPNFKLNLLFIEHDHGPEATFCGFEDLNYEFEILSGQDYLDYEFEKELFNGVGQFDYTPFLTPLLNFEAAIGEEKVDEINEAISMYGYMEEVKKYFLLYAYLSIHDSFDKIKHKINQFEIPRHDEVFMFVNEHDCEQLNVWVWEK